MYKQMTVALAGMFLLLAGAADAASRDLGSTVDFTIGSQSLGAALLEFSAQTGMQVVTSGADVRNLKTRGISGKTTVREALEKLLSGSGLSFRLISDNTIGLVRKNADADPARRSSVAPADQMRLAAVEGNERTQAQAEADSGKDASQVVVNADRDRPAPFSTGNLDLTRTEDDVLPFQVFTAREIELSGMSSLQEFLRERLPQNFSSEVPEETDGEAVGLASYLNQVDMRGWGTVETVFLLNGRRMPSEYQGIMIETTNATPNLNAIPLASIERIEILGSAGSVIYGANATGGVINIITRQDFSGGQVSMNYATPTDANAPRRDVQLSYGFALNPRLSLNLSAGYSDSQPLRVGDRSDVTIERWRQRVGIGHDGTIPSSPYAARPNIRAASATSGDLFPDIPGVQPYAHPATGYDGGGLRNFQPGVDLELADGTAGSGKYAKGSFLGRETASMTLSLGTQIRLNEHWRWSIDSHYARTDSEGRPNASLGFASANPTSILPRVPGAAAINPFEQDVLVYIVDPRLDRPEIRNKPNTMAWGLSTTLHGQIGEWRGFLDLSFSHNRNRLRNNVFYEPEGGWRNAFLTGQYNPFVDVTRVSPALPEFYEQYTVRRTYTDSATRNYATDIKFSGPLFRLNANVAQLTVGLGASRGDRYRSLEISRYEDAATGAIRIPVGTTSSLNNNPRARFVFNSYAGYAETTVPLISKAQGVPLIRGLDIFGSGRLDYTVRDGFRTQSVAEQQSGVTPQSVKYSHSTHLYALGFKYQIVEGMAFRVSQSIGFKPPNLTQVTPADPPTQECCSGGSIMDPIRNETLILTPDMYFTGGNTDLEAESTESTNLGVILMPAWARGLRVSVDYIENIRNNAIFAFFTNAAGVQDALDLESGIPGLISRDPPDGHPSGVGPVRFVDLRLRNLTMISSKSIDFSIAQQLTDVLGGSLSLNVRASRNLSFKIQRSITGPAEEQLRRQIALTSISSQQIAWNANGQLRWDGQRWGLGWSMRYLDYRLVSGSSASQLATRIQGQGSDRIPWKMNHDINVSYRVPVTQNPRGPQWLLSGTSVSFTVQNLFNREPRFWYQSTDYGVAPGDSIAGRTLTLSIRKDL